MASRTTKLRSLIGEKTAAALNDAFGYISVDDLLHHFPRRYVKRGELTPIKELHEGEEGTFMAMVDSVKSRPIRTRKGSILEIVVTDGHEKLKIAFFNQAWRERELKVGQKALFAGKISTFKGIKQLAHPDYELVPEVGSDEAVAAFAGRYIPIYPSSTRIPSWKLAKSIEIVLDSVDEIEDPLPPELLAKLGLPSLQEAIFTLHRPDSIERAELSKERLIYDEALLMQLLLVERRAELESLTTVARHGTSDGILDTFDKTLPYTLTDGQNNVAQEIETDLAAAHPMHRLLQGEVGSGKTIVALRAMLRVIDSGGQAALLAPTEVLAAQHFHTMTKLLGDLAHGALMGGENATRIVLITGSQSAQSRKESLAAAASGEAGIVVGTHALLGEKVEFKDLGLIVVDEQHRFGVEQRDALRSKALNPPHMLVMTATPIPRTVAMTIFGDLDVSTLTELPRGRQPITTHLVPEIEKPAYLERAWARIVEEVKKGHQAYIVAPRIVAGTSEDADMEFLFGEESKEIASVEELGPQLKSGVFHELRVAPLHGKLSPELKDSTMKAFAAGELDVLISTTVIEVGVDVPNATVMVVMDAERFGVSQLHQLRGRIGRGVSPGLCLLVTKSLPGTPARERLEAVASTQDGFELSRIDLEQRREGDVLGRSQSGTLSHLRMLRVLRDEKVIEKARADALELYPHLASYPQLQSALNSLKQLSQSTFIEKG